MQNDGMVAQAVAGSPTRSLKSSRKRRDDSAYFSLLRTGGINKCRISFNFCFACTIVRALGVLAPAACEYVHRPREIHQPLSVRTFTPVT